MYGAPKSCSNTLVRPTDNLEHLARTMRVLHHDLSFLRHRATKYQDYKGYTPIRSARFGDRMKVDPVDMRTCRRKNLFGVMMQYIVVSKDHFTGFMAAASIPRKRPAFVTQVLTEIFGH